MNTTMTADNEYGLVHLNRLGHDALHVWERDYLKLAGWWAVPRELYENLPPWEKARAHAVARGRSARKAVVTGVAAARIWRLPVLTQDPTVELLMPGTKVSGATKTPPGAVFRAAKLAVDSPEIRIVEGARVVHPLRAMRDIVAYGDELEALVVCDAMRRRWPSCSRDSLLAQVEAMPRFRGKGRLRKVIMRSVDCADSPLETKARVILEAMLAEGELQSLVPQTLLVVRKGDVERRFRVDFLVNGRLVVEVDGRVKYDGQSYGEDVNAVVREEHGREYAIRGAGYRVLRVRAEDLTVGGPRSSQLAEWVRRELRDL